MTLSTNIPQYDTLFSDNPSLMKQISVILNTKLKLLNSNLNPSAHNIVSAAVDCNNYPSQSPELEWQTKYLCLVDVYNIFWNS